MKSNYLLKTMLTILLAVIVTHSWSQYQMEKLDRGVVAMSLGGSKVFVSWRWLGTEDDITFNLYRNGTKLNATPLAVCNYTDNAGSTTASYAVRAVVNGVEQTASNAVTPWAQQYMKVPLSIPAGGTTPDGVAYTYSPNDCSIGDVDGDGKHEIFLKWDPSNSKDNSQSGYTGNVFIDCYTMTGTLLWRIDLGRNIRAGAHYTQFLVYDFDGDGMAEMACKTADGTKDGKGVVIGNATADFRNSSGYVLSGPEFLTVFNGKTGAAMATANYTPGRGTVSSWGDNYGNRVDRFIAVVAYLDGQHPSMVFGRGYYTRLVRSAWDWKNGKLTQRWIFDSNTAGNGAYASMGNHQMTVGDVDGDGKQEFCNGASAINDDGTGLYANGLGHGDALHMTDMDPDRPGLEVWQCHEEPARYGNYGLEFRDARTGQSLWGLGGGNQGDVGRAMAADIDPRHKGYECWGSSGVLYDCKGNQIGTSKPSVNFAVYWDGDLQRELLDGGKLDKWNYTGGSSTRLASLYTDAYGTGTACNGTKATPNLSADLFGDWREEIILHSADNANLIIYTTPIASAFKFRTLLHDPQYRMAIAWQNAAYNQPPHLGYYLGSDMVTPAKPVIAIVGSPTNQVPSINITNPTAGAIFTAPASITVSANATDADGTITNVQFFNGTTLLGSDATAPYGFTWTSVAAGTYSITAKATDNGGAVTTSTAVSVTVKAPNVAPAVSITAPANSATFTAPASITVTANATDADGTITNVQFFNGTTLLGSDATAPYSFAWTNVAVGTYSITVKATDNSGAVTTSTAVSVTVKAPNVAPAVTITAPANNAVFIAPASISIAANATDTDGTIANVQFFSGSTLLGTDATAPYGFVWSNVTTGTYLLTAKATDNSGAVTTSSAITVVVNAPNVAPGVNITAPTANASYTAPATVSITANATDTDGTVSSVQFFNGATLLGSDATAPYSFSWTNVATGTYTITAVATDNSGATTTSGAITITVTNPLPLTIQAETACSVDGILLETTNAGFNGTGYVNTNNAVGSSIKFSVNSTTAQSVSLTIRFANASATSMNRSMSLNVNGTTQIASISFPSTGAWTTWTTALVNVTLTAGTNTLSFVSLTSEGGPNIDELTYNPGTVTAGTCTAAAKSLAVTMAPAQAVVAPNPSSGAFSITVSEAVQSYTVTNSVGTTVISGSTIASGASVSFGETLISGLYTLRIQYSSGRIETKTIQKIM